MRKAIICIAAVVLVIMLLCPPWRDVHNYQDKGYHWITSPPGKRWYEPNYRDYPGRYVQDAVTIDFARLGMQVAILAVVAGTPLLLMRRPDRP
jgi:hypothetical protein